MVNETQDKEKEINNQLNELKVQLEVCGVNLEELKID